MHRKDVSRAAGFSLLEVLVASAILAVVMMVLLNTLSTSLSLWRSTENKAFADREARGAELLLAEDFAGVVMPSEPGLWPKVSAGENNVLQLLTVKPSDYDEPDKPGDVFFVEYRVDGPSGTIQRAVMDAEKTYNEVLRIGEFPAPGATLDATNKPLLAASHVLAKNQDAARGLGDKQRDEANNTNFVVLNADLLPLAGGYSTNNAPAAVEVNFAVTDPDTMRNTELRTDANFIMRSAGLYSTRFRLPPPMEPR